MPKEQLRRLQARGEANSLAAAALERLEDSDIRALSNLAWSQAIVPLGPPCFLPKVLTQAG